MFRRADLFPATLGVRVDPVDETTNGDVITLDRIHSLHIIAEMPGWGQFAVLDCDCDRYWSSSRMARGLLPCSLATANKRILFKPISGYHCRSLR